jgi:predicted DsbA family dithiol-disulfide isomerase
MNDHVSTIAASVGLDFRLDIARPANTFRAHRLIHHAADHGLANELTERLMRGYFCEGVRVGDREDLLRMAVAVGLDEAEAAAVLDSAAYADNVRADIDLARQFGATGVPFFVFDRKYGISGAQDAAVFTEVLATAWADAHPLITVGASAEYCDDNACALPERGRHRPGRDVRH